MMNTVDDATGTTASSPQAKGPVERNNGAHQVLLMKKLPRQGIQS
jgi:hypothetical protein